MLHIFICEDNELQRLQINDIVQNYIIVEELDMDVVISSTVPDKIIKYLSEHLGITGLYIIDIDLNNNINGLILAEIIRKYDPRGFIVFITGHGEALPLTFKYKVEALDFITKTDFQVSKRLCECINNAYIKYTGKPTELNDNFVFKANHHIIAVKKDEILYFETSLETAHKITIYTINGIYNFYGKIKDIENELVNGFIRCHKSYLINKKKIKYIDTTTNIVYMENNTKCPVSIRQMPTLINQLRLKPT